MSTHRHSRSSEQGFTLVELAIVLVIIGLIVGGVLVGQDLIKAATIRAAVTELERYDAAANTFRNKYNGLPGDLSNPTLFFAAVQNANNGNGRGDNDALIEGLSNATTVCTANTCISGEAALFWYELAQAGLIANPITTTDMTITNLTPSDAVLPPSKLGRGARVGVHSFTGRNYYLLFNPGTGALTNGTATFGAGMTPLEASQIDGKMDDGIPNTGKVLSVLPATALAPTADNGAAMAAVGPTTCFVNNTTPVAYATTTYNGNNNTDLIVCTLSIRTSF